METKIEENKEVIKWDKNEIYIIAIDKCRYSLTLLTIVKLSDIDKSRQYQLKVLIKAWIIL